ncbi:MAG TPA: polysaccharide biosynthesis/export family protein [Kofleriaceae bacterium]|nr:polysaccharide biosynthesis/export family protein [Kofleriaceae bacterium]
MRAVIEDLRIGRLVAALVLVLAAGCPPKIPTYDYAKEPDPRNKELVLGVGDVIGINVWENPNLSVEATIRPDGTITMPLVGDLKAAGETPTSLKNRIKNQLQAYVKMQGTEVTVAVKAWRSYRFTIQGEVSKAGVFSSDQFLTVSDALALAGGLSRFAKRNEITLTRKDGKSGQVRHIPLDYESLASGKRPDMNIIVMPGDTIWVP